MKILVIHGPNMNLLGLREPDIYGKTTYAELLEMIRGWARDLDLEVAFFQSNHEGALVDAIQEAYGNYDGIILNPAAYTHTSIAIPDALRAVGLPAAEVHISDPATREPYRRISYTAPACAISYSGLGPAGYQKALCFLKTLLATRGGSVL